MAIKPSKNKAMTGYDKSHPRGGFGGPQERPEKQREKQEAKPMAAKQEGKSDDQ